MARPSGIDSAERSHRSVHTVVGSRILIRPHHLVGHYLEFPSPSLHVEVIPGIGRPPGQDFSRMPQNEYIEQAVKRHGHRLDHDEKRWGVYIKTWNFTVYYFQSVP